MNFHRISWLYKTGVIKFSIDPVHSVKYRHLFLLLVFSIFKNVFHHLDECALKFIFKMIIVSCSHNLL